MESLLQFSRSGSLFLCGRVAILVLVESLLQFEQTHGKLMPNQVAILVLVESLLQFLSGYSYDSFIECRNPCFSGISFAMQLSSGNVFSIKESQSLF